MESALQPVESQNVPYSYCMHFYYIVFTIWIFLNPSQVQIMHKNNVLSVHVEKVWVEQIMLAHTVCHNTYECIIMSSMHILKGWFS